MKSTSKTFWKQRYLMVLTLPVVLWMILFNYVPMAGLIIAFKEYTPYQGFLHSPWTGLANFRELFSDPTFTDSVLTTLKISTAKLAFGFFPPIILAILLNELRLKMLKKVVQSLTYLPHFISWVLVVGFMYTLLDPDTGVISQLLTHAGLMDKGTLLLGSESAFLPLVVISDIWKGIGWNSIIYLAAIAGIDTQQYEAAVVDGANRFQRIWFITLPALKPTILIIFILCVGSLISSNFDQLFLMQNSMTQDAANALSIYSYKTGLVTGRFSYGTAIGLFESIVAFSLMFMANFVSRKTTKESLF